jgi:membrane protease YdiL (CAAX protease family)
MTVDSRPPGLWARLPVTFRAVVSGLGIGLIAANVWPLLLIALDPFRAALAELLFLILYLWWASGGLPPRSTRAARTDAFRAGRFSAKQWAWSLVAGLAFATAVHAALVVLFRLVPFPEAAFRQGYDLSAIPGEGAKWVVIVVSALSAGICEETGFRGYMQRPLERRHGPAFAILVSSVFFTLLHLNKAWSIPPMIPLVFGAGLFLGVLAWASGSLVPGMIGHAVMDTGLFAFWWSGVAGTFTARPIGETGVDAAFVLAAGVGAAALLLLLTATIRLQRLRLS